MIKLRAVFEKMFMTLKRVQDNELRLTKKCRQLNDDIADNVGKINTILELTHEEELAKIDTDKVI